MVRSERHKRRKLFHPRPFVLSITVFTLLALASWITRSFSQSKLGASNIVFQKRAASSDYGPDLLTTLLSDPEQTLECRLVHHADDKCAFVKRNCPDEEGLFPYIQLYYCSLHHVKPLAFVILIALLSLLFSTIGIAASDFLCINLSTIASILGMSESLTGVTFLAFGNGSPDVFSTFAAMGSNSGSLAVGELIGAACFITAVVAGSMALVRPFRVARRSFVRDVGYFIIAGSFSLAVLADGELHIWECVTMIGLYIFYVIMVVSWHWYLTRKRRKHERDFAARAHFHIPQSQELDLQEPASDDDPIAGETRSLLHAQDSPDFDALEMDQQPAWKEDDETRNRYLAEIRENMHVARPIPPQRRTTVNPIRPSLVGALEFQSVLSSLQKAKNIHDDTIDLPRYSDDNFVHQSRYRGSASAFVNRIQKTSNAHHQDNSNRNRSVSMNDVPDIQINTTNIPSAATRSQPEVSTNNMSLHPENLDGPTFLESPLLTTSPTSSDFSANAEANLPPPQSNGHLTIPGDTFRAPNYQVSPRSSHLSSGDVSPMSHGRVPRITSSSETDETSPVVPFPAFIDTPPAPSSPLRLPSSLPPPALRTSGIGPENGLVEEPILAPAISKWWPPRFLPPIRLVFVTLFPTLCGWITKSVWEKILGVVAAPSVFCLTITVPVIDPKRGDADDEAEPPSANDGTEQIRPIIRLPDDSPILPPLNEVSSVDHHMLDGDPRSVHDAQSSISRRRLDSEMPTVPTQSSDGFSQSTRIWYPWLTVVQAFTAPLFVIVIVWSNLDDDHNPKKLIIPVLCSLLGSLFCATMLIIVLKDRNLSQPPNWLRPILAFIGFLVGICWIATIADEVVSLLKTLGVIMDISDSLLGLTVFAVGNSLGDLVADVTVARLGYPVMALSACFGGPMLNILLGIGIGGLYMSWHSTQHQISPEIERTEPYRIMISKTLLISGLSLLVTLLGLLIIVPLNGWKMDRRIGWGLVVLWTLSTLGNVIAEIVT